MQKFKKSISIFLSLLTLMSMLTVANLQVLAASTNPYDYGNPPTRTLINQSSMMTGNDVKWVQAALNLYGNYGLKVDGMYGSASASATKKFQKAMSLDADGMFGPKSTTAMKNWLSSKKNIKGKTATSTTKTSTSSSIKENLKKVTGVKQVSDKCTSCALTTLFRRKQVAQGKKATITFDQVRAYVNYEFKFTNKATKTIPYNTTCVTKSTITNKGYTVKSYVKSLLDKYPEGVEIYCKHDSSKHAIVISDYETVSGKIQFYAYDPVNGTTRIKLESTWLYSRCGKSVDKLFNNLDRLLYVS